jgi:parallel beta-helix repeat protein
MSLMAAMLAAALFPAGASAATIPVTNVNDSGAGSLRQAIVDATTSPVPDEIVLTATGTIALATQLPELSSDTTLSGTATNGVPNVALKCPLMSPTGATGLQAGAGQTGILITNVSVTGCTNGVFALADSGLELRGSWIHGNAGNGVAALAGAHLVVGGSGAGYGNLIEGNGFGVAADSPAARSIVRGNTITGSAGNGVDMELANDVVVEDNVVSGNAANGIIFFRGEGARIRGNRVGTDASGATAQPNGFSGINLRGTLDAVVGGTKAPERNVVAGAAGTDLCAICIQSLDGVRATRTVVLGNHIGATASGLSGFTPAGFDGIRVVEAVDTAIGGTAPGAGNLVGGWAHFGMRIDGGSSGTTIQGNTVGIRADGAGALPNQLGIDVEPDSSGTRVGGTVPAARNIVGGNAIGIYAGGAGTRVERNLVGLAPNGRTVLGNQIGIALDGGAAGLRVGDGTQAGANVVSGNSRAGVMLSRTAGAIVAGNVIGRTADGAESRPNGFLGGVLLIDNKGGVIGGSTPSAANLIDGGVYPSIRAEGAGQLGTQFLGNLLRGTRHSLGIDLLPLALTPNDPGDGDKGPNGLQNAPIVTGAGRTAVAGTVGTTAARDVRVQVFRSSADGRETYALLGEAVVRTDAAGAAAFSVPVSLAEGTAVVATTTTVDGTSELSPPATVQPTPPAPSFGLDRARFSVRNGRLRVRIRNATVADARVRVKAKDKRTSVKAAKTLKAVTKTLDPDRSATFKLKLPASTRRKLSSTLRRKGKARYRPAITVTNLTSGVDKTYKPKIKVTRRKG